MVTGIQNLYDQRARIVEQMKSVALNAAKEGRAMSAEESQTWAKMEADEAALTATIQASEKAEQLEARAAAQHFTEREKASPKADKGEENAYRSAFMQVMRSGVRDLDKEQRALIEKRGTNTQIVGTDSLGGYLVPDEWMPGIESYLKDYSGIYEAATIKRSPTGASQYYAVNDDTSSIAVQVGEASSFTVQDFTFSQVQMDAYKFGTVVKESYEILQDNDYQLEAWFMEQFGARFGRSINNKCTLGNGSATPNGVVTASTLGKTAASATAFTYLELLDLKHSIDPAYRRSAKFGFMMNDAVLLAVKKLVDSQNRPLWMPSYVQGAPDTIDGTRYWINQDMDSSINASSKLILAGDFSKYYIRISGGMQVKRLDELFAMDGVVGWQAWMRYDGECVNTSAIKHLITAAS